MDLSAGVPEAKSAPRNGWNGVAPVIYPPEVCDLGVKEFCPGCITHSGSRECNGLYRRICGEIELHKQRVEFRKGCTERMTGLQPEE